MNPVRKAYNVARTAQKTLMGATITISRGLKTSGMVVVTVGQSGSIAYEDDGSTTYTKNRDYLIDVKDYKFTGDSEPSIPSRMDVITEVIDGVVTTFTVTAIGGQEEYVYHNDARTVFRVHAKEV